MSSQPKLWKHCHPLLTHTECKPVRLKNCAVYIYTNIEEVPTGPVKYFIMISACIQ